MAPGGPFVRRTMHMHIPQARNQELSRAVDNRSVFGDTRFLLRGADGNDAIAIHDHSHIRRGAASGRIDYGDVFDYKRLRPSATAAKSEQENRVPAEGLGVSRAHVVSSFFGMQFLPNTISCRIRCPFGERHRQYAERSAPVAR